MAKRVVRIALAPIKYFDLSRKDNLVKVMEYIREAGRKEADIICFPESCLHKTAVLEINNPILIEIQKVCKKNKIWCIVTEDFRLGKKPYNTAILIGRDGSIKGKYKKIYLSGDETKSGKRTSVFKTDFGKIGIVICWDLAFPELFSKMREKGAEIVFCPAQWRYERRAYDKKHKERETRLLKSLITTRAFENNYFVAICNPLTDETDQVSYSAVASPHRILNDSIDKEELLITDVDLSDINKFKKIYQEYSG
jgi:predicted amidohydrolase